VGPLPFRVDGEQHDLEIQLPEHGSRPIGGLAEEPGQIGKLVTNVLALGNKWLDGGLALEIGGVAGVARAFAWLTILRANRGSRKRGLSCRLTFYLRRGRESIEERGNHDLVDEQFQYGIDEGVRVPSILRRHGRCCAFIIWVHALVSSPVRRPSRTGPTARSSCRRYSASRKSSSSLLSQESKAHLPLSGAGSSSSSATGTAVGGH
jgi:hypothetical protein